MASRGWGITTYGLQAPYLALGAVWVLTMVWYLAGPKTKGRELEDLANEVFDAPVRDRA